MHIKHWIFREKLDTKEDLCYTVHEGSAQGKSHKECRCRYVDMTIFVMTIFVMKYSS